MATDEGARHAAQQERDAETGRLVPAQLRYMIMVALISIFVILGAGYGYLRHLQSQQANTKSAICDTANDTIKDYKRIGTDSAKQLADDWTRLRDQLKC